MRTKESVLKKITCSNWISSNGSAFIMLPKSHANNWDAVKDYESTFYLPDFANLIDWNGISTVVLGDAPMDTAVLRFQEEYMIVRWVYAENEDEIFNYLSKSDLNTFEPIEENYVEFADVNLVIFDASMNFFEGDFLSIILPKKHIFLTTYVLNFADDCKIIAHRFLLEKP